MKQTHTPGPWKRSSLEPLGLKLVSHQERICVADAGVSGRISQEEMEANCCLISAAPDLLEALEEAYRQIIEFLNEGDFKRDVHFDSGYIVDAIAKAKGEEP